MEIETGTFHTTSPNTLGVYHISRDCLHARRIKPWNICYGGEPGCSWCPSPRCSNRVPCAGRDHGRGPAQSTASG